MRWVIPERAAYWPDETLVTAAILRRGNAVLLTRRAQGEKLAGLWEFPGGKVHEGETPEACLARELKEELALECVIGAKVAESEYRYDHGAFTILAYEAEIQSGTLQLTVHDWAEWIEIEKLLDHDLAPADIPIAQALQSEARSPVTIAASSPRCGPVRRGTGPSITRAFRKGVMGRPYLVALEGLFTTTCRSISVCCRRCCWS